MSSYFLLYCKSIVYLIVIASTAVTVVAVYQSQYSIVVESIENASIGVVKIAGCKTKINAHSFSFIF